jgi:hypothetical protein
MVGVWTRQAKLESDMFYPQLMTELERIVEKDLHEEAQINWRDIAPKILFSPGGTTQL